MVNHHVCPVSASLFSRKYWFPQLLQRQCGAFVLIAFNCEPSLYANYHLKPSCKPITGVSQGTILKVPRRVREGSSLTQGLTMHLLTTITWNDGRSLRHIIGWKSFLSESRIEVELTRRTGRRVLVSTVQGCLLATGYCSRHPDRCSRVTPDYCCCRRTLANRVQNWNHQYWLHAIIDDESRVRRRASFMVLTVIIISF